MDIGRECWVLSDGTIGMEKQSLALAGGLGLPVELKRVRVKQPWRSLTAKLWCMPMWAIAASSAPLDAPYPAALISTGGRVVPIAAALRRASGLRTRTVQIQNPRYRLDAFDLVIAPRHDRLQGGNVVETHGSLHGITPAVLADARQRFAPLVAAMERPIVSVLLGGNSRRHRFTMAAAERLGAGLAKLANQGVGLLLTASRRTPADVVGVMQRHLSSSAYYLWDGTGENPYLGLLGLADALVVTNDSVNMLSEAAATGKPVHVFDLEGGSARFDRFLQHMRELGITRPFAGQLEQWSYTPPDDTERAIAAVRELLTIDRETAR